MGLNLALVAPAANGGILSFLPTILMFVVLIYFMIIRPQKKRQTEAKNLLASLKVGDKVQTIGGFIGELLEINDDDFVILSEESKLRIKKSAVAIRLNAEEATVVSTSTEEEDDEDFKIEDFEI